MDVRLAARAVATFAGRAGMIALALLAAAVVTSVSVDLGPTLRARAERAGSAQLQRRVTVGGLSVRLFDGRFVLRNVVIGGLDAAAEPFLKAGEIQIAMPLTALLRREILVTSIEMTDWRMKVETFPGGRHNFPSFTRNRESTGPGTFSTTLSYIHAYRGHFAYIDHGTPWSTEVPGLDITVMKLAGYRGFSRSSTGVVRIQDYEPMAASLNTWFHIAGGLLLIDRLELDSYGATTRGTGRVDFKHWPEQTYDITSDVQMPQMREIFWAHDDFTLTGQARFQGSFHLFRGGRELKGDFSGADAALAGYEFPDLEGSLVWTAERFDVTRAQSGFYGGTADFTYALAPLGRPDPTIATLDARYTDVDLATFSDAMAFNGLRLAGHATGANLLQWPLGRFSEHQGSGSMTASPPSGVVLRTKGLPARLPDPSFAHVFGDPFPPLGYVPVGGAVAYRYGPEWIDFAASRVATPTTYVEFEGRTAYGDRSHIPFHVTSTDWQESDRLLAGIMTAAGSPTRAIEIAGAGTFDGVLLKAIARPRIEGLFVAAQLRAWDVDWGSGQSRIVVENSYLDATDAVARKGGAEMRAQGRFALGYPRRDGGEEINARIQATGWPLVDYRHAFLLDDYEVDGSVTGELRLYGAYEGPFGFGRVTVAPGVYYDERILSASAGLRFEGTGVWLDGIDVRKGATGVIRGAANVKWAGSYSFQVDGRQVPVESIDLLAFPSAPLTGVAEFTAGGSGVFDYPVYEVRGRLRDLYVGDEGIGQVSGRIGLAGDDMTFELEAASPRLAVSGSGRMTLLGDYAGDMQFRFTDTSLDPYARVFAPALSPFVGVVASGTVRASGSFASINGVAARARLERVNLDLFDYKLRNDGAIDIGLDQSTLRLHAFRLAGEDTRLQLSGNVDLGANQVAVRAEGDANLAVLQGFFRDLRSSGRAVIGAEFSGPLDRPTMTGSAFLTNGRLRYMWLPHAIESINGRVTFAGQSIRIDDLRATIGRGEVRFGGRVGLEGFWPSVLDLTANGEAMELRYPAGFRSVVDADLGLRGTLASPLLTGTIHVRGSSLKRRIDIGAGMIEWAGTGGAGPPAAMTGFPLRFDVRIVAPGTLEVDNNVARMTATADLTLRGTYDRPLLEGHAQVDRGEVRFEGKRYIVTRGNLDFVNATRLEPTFDIEAETRVRAPGQTYRVTLRFVGTMARLQPEIVSDPPLPLVDILSLLFGDAGATQDAELRALQDPNTAETTLLGARAARLLASPIASNVGRVVEQTFGLETFQITPMLTDPTQQSGRLTAGARLTIGTRISDRVYLTFSRSLTSATRDQVVLLEYDQTDHLSWVATQNEDKTYALEVRVRHVF